MTHRKGNRLGPFIFGLIVGIALTGAAVWMLMPRMMLVVHASRYDTVEETADHLKAAIEARGWKVPAVRNMNQAMAQQGVTMETPVRIIELCNAGYAKQVLTTNPEVSALMPCALGIYEGSDGNVYISGMNMALMGKMFGGTIATVMGGSVAQDEKLMLRDIIK